jgi:hypothetical protein
MHIARYDEYVSENYQTLSSSDVNRITNLISKRFPKVGKHNDAQVLLCVAQAHGVDSFLFISGIEMSDDAADIRKVYIKSDGRYIDTTGVHTREDVCKAHNIATDNFGERTHVGGADKVKSHLKHTYKRLPLSDVQERELMALLPSLRDK